MVQIENTPDILTPDEAAVYLRIDRETVYRYIRAGKLEASRLGRHYRIPRRSIEQLLIATRVQPVRVWSDEQIKDFMGEDTLNDKARLVTKTFDAVRTANGPQTGHSTPRE